MNSTKTSLAVSTAADRLIAQRAIGVDDLCIAPTLPLGDTKVVRVRNLPWVYFVKDHEPRARDVIARLPLGNAPLCKPGNLHYLGSATHCFDNLACIHAS
jgi:hypothetical protein